jgi:hypothetical protein
MDQAGSVRLIRQLHVHDALIIISPLLLIFSPAPEQMNALSVSFMTGEPVFSWPPLISTVASCAIFIAVAIWRFNHHEL